MLECHAALVYVLYPHGYVLYSSARCDGTVWCRFGAVRIEIRAFVVHVLVISVRHGTARARCGMLDQTSHDTFGTLILGTHCVLKIRPRDT